MEKNQPYIVSWKASTNKKTCPSKLFNYLDTYFGESFLRHKIRRSLEIKIKTIQHDRLSFELLTYYNIIIKAILIIHFPENQ